VSLDSAPLPPNPSPQAPPACLLASTLHVCDAPPFPTGAKPLRDADFLHTNIVLCRPFADLVHILSRVNVLNSNAAARPAGGPSALYSSLFKGEGAEVAVQWPPLPPELTPLGEAAHEGVGDGCRRHRRGRGSAVSPTQSSIGYRRSRLRGLPGEERRHARTGRGERACRRGARGEGLGGTGAGSRCASKQEPARARGPGR
jgi:hypothetical protein